MNHNLAFIIASNKEELDKKHHSWDVNTTFDVSHQNYYLDFLSKSMGRLYYTRGELSAIIRVVVGDLAVTDTGRARYADEVRPINRRPDGGPKDNHDLYEGDQSGMYSIRDILETISVLSNIASKMNDGDLAFLSY